MRRTTSLVLSVFVFSFLVVIAPCLHAQITRHIDADISHPFIVGQATLPPGDYVFRMMQQTDLSVMTVNSKDGGTSVEFLVRPSQNSHVPNHNELVFDRYGSKDFLINIYQRGEPIGVAVVEPSREESRLLKMGQIPAEHTEEQPE
ncbi:MAG TPA: hypothetical protein VMD29_10960 [Terracidiphilus sp.]|jgi:hypothetical protein|nr:hypothetical protein [Terracidiphilus sp.]